MENAVYTELTQEIEKLSRLSIAEEGLISRFLFKSLDVFSRLFNNVIHVTLRSFKGFSRSEIRYYIESNPMMVKQIRKLSYIDIRTVKIPYPTGMKIGYKPALDTITNLLAPIDATALVLSAQRLVTQIQEQGFTNPELVHEVQCWTQDNKILDRSVVTRSLKPIFSTTDTSIIELPFSKFFSNMNDFNYTLDNLVLCEKYYHQAKKSYDNLTTMNSIVDKIITRFESDKSLITKDTAQILYEFLFTLAEQLDLFGALCNELQRIEHNFVLVCRALNSKV